MKYSSCCPEAAAFRSPNASTDRKLIPSCSCAAMRHTASCRTTQPPSPTCSCNSRRKSCRTSRKYGNRSGHCLKTGRRVCGASGSWVPAPPISCGSVCTECVPSRQGMSTPRSSATCTRFCGKYCSRYTVIRHTARHPAEAVPQHGAGGAGLRLYQPEFCTD